jgi:hypothetical protein
VPFEFAENLRAAPQLMTAHSESETSLVRTSLALSGVKMASAGRPSVAAIS